jgi:hypothetical protein
MNREEQIWAKALELAILAVGPLSEEDRTLLRNDNRKAPVLLGQYASFADTIVTFLDEIPAGCTK